MIIYIYSCVCTKTLCRQWRLETFLDKCFYAKYAQQSSKRDGDLQWKEEKTSIDQREEDGPTAYRYTDIVILTTPEAVNVNSIFCILDARTSATGIKEEEEENPSIYTQNYTKHTIDFSFSLSLLTSLGIHASAITIIRTLMA